VIFAIQVPNATHLCAHGRVNTLKVKQVMLILYSISPIYDNYTSRACASDAHKVIEFFALFLEPLAANTYLLHWGLNNEAISETKREK
jgi:hypothetical protein